MPDEESPPENVPQTAPSEGDTEGERMDLPKWNRHKVKRKAPAGSEQDAFQGAVRRAGRKAIMRPGVALAALIVIPALIAGGAWIVDQRQQQTADRTQILARAAAASARGEVFESEEVKAMIDKRVRPPLVPLADDLVGLDAKTAEALAELDDVAEGEALDRLGDLLRAAAAMKAGEFGEAERLYREFIESHDDHPLVFLAHEGLALALEAQGKLDDALAAVEAVVGETGDFYRDQALWHKARVLEAQGKADEALAVYETYVTEYPAESGPLAMAKVHARVRELKPELLEVKPSAPAEAIVDDGEQAPAGGAQAPEGGGPEDSAPPAAGAEVEP